MKYTPGEKILQENKMGVNHSLPKQKTPADGLYAVTYKCFPHQPDATVIYAKDRQGATPISFD